MPASADGGRDLGLSFDLRSDCEETLACEDIIITSGVVNYEHEEVEKILN